MAKTDSVKKRSHDHELFAARIYGGNLTKNSGALWTDQGDVRTTQYLIECKQTGSVAKPASSIRIILSDLEKIVDEARSEGKTPLMCLRIYNPSSVIAGFDGNIDLALRLVRDDQEIDA